MAYGETLAVQAIDVRESVPTLAAISRAGGPVRTLVERDRQARIEGADLVVRGRVTAVRLGDNSAKLRHTEYAPLWQDAVVDVQAIEKGTNPGSEIVICFPASADIKFIDRPKFTPCRQSQVVKPHPIE